MISDLGFQGFRPKSSYMYVIIIVIIYLLFIRCKKTANSLHINTILQSIKGTFVSATVS